MAGGNISVAAKPNVITYLKTLANHVRGQGAPNAWKSNLVGWWKTDAKIQIKLQRSINLGNIECHPGQSAKLIRADSMNFIRTLAPYSIDIIDLDASFPIFQT